MTTITAKPTDDRPTHHVRLYRDAYEVGLILQSNNAADKRGFSLDPIPSSALKTFQGEQEYADTEPPWSNHTQKDLSGGRGQSDFDLDPSRFLDSYRADTSVPGKAINGPEEVYTYGHRSIIMYRNYVDGSLGGSIYRQWPEMIDDQSNLATQYTLAADMDISNIYVDVRKRGSPPNLTIAILDDAFSELDSVVVPSVGIDEFISVPLKVTFDTPVSVAATDVIYIAIKTTPHATDPDNNYWSVLCSDDEASQSGIQIYR